MVQNLVEKKKEETDLEEEGVQGNETVPVTKGLYKKYKIDLFFLVGLFYKTSKKLY